MNALAIELTTFEYRLFEYLVREHARVVAALTDNLNTLVRQERARQKRYKEALSYLAQSLKTPLAVLHTALDEPARLAAVVT